jgi:hypothetical protein
VAENAYDNLGSSNIKCCILFCALHTAKDSAKGGSISGRMPSSGMWRRIALVRTDVSEDRIASVIRVKRISELGTLAVSSNRSIFLHPFVKRWCWMSGWISRWAGSHSSSRGGVTSRSLIHPFVEEESPSENKTMEGTQECHWTRQTTDQDWLCWRGLKQLNARVWWSWSDCGLYHVSETYIQNSPLTYTHVVDQSHNRGSTQP